MELYEHSQEEISKISQIQNVFLTRLGEYLQKGKSSIVSSEKKEQFSNNKNELYLFSVLTCIGITFISIFSFFVIKIGIVYAIIVLLLISTILILFYKFSYHNLEKNN